MFAREGRGLMNVPGASVEEFGLHISRGSLKVLSTTRVEIVVEGEGRWEINIIERKCRSAGCG